MRIKNTVLILMLFTIILTNGFYIYRTIETPKIHGFVFTITPEGTFNRTITIEPMTGYFITFYPQNIEETIRCQYFLK